MLNQIVWNRTVCIKMDLVLNNLQWLICHKTQPTNQKMMIIHWSWCRKITENVNTLLAGFRICCISYSGVRPFILYKRGCLGYNAKLYSMVKVQFWRSVECGVPLHCLYSQLHFVDRNLISVKILNNEITPFP